MVKLWRFCLPSEDLPALGDPSVLQLFPGRKNDPAHLLVEVLREENHVALLLVRGLPRRASDLHVLRVVREHPVGSVKKLQSAISELEKPDILVKKRVVDRLKSAQS